MLKQLLNECLIDLVIKPDGPVLVKSGLDTVRGPDMTFVKTWRNGDQEVYLPGSSLKGVLRSHAERITRTLNAEAACDPFMDGKKARETSGVTTQAAATWIFCGERFKQRENSNPLTNEELYAHSCPICRLFGSTYYGGRLATADAYAINSAPRPERRDGVGIDRFTGGAAKGAKFDFEVITGGEFATSLHLRNFELWQLGLVGFLLEDLKAGLIRIGMGKSRGLGKVTAEIKNVQLHYLGRQAPRPENGQLKLLGLGSLGNGAAKAYGVVQPDEVTLEYIGEFTGNPVRTIYPFGAGDSLWPPLAQAWVNYLDQYEVPAEMAGSRFVKQGSAS